MDTGAHPDAVMHGDAYVNGKFGLTLDGSGDYLTVAGEDTIAYAASGEFGVSMWFTRKDCIIPGRYEMLFGHHQVRVYPFERQNTSFVSTKLHQYRVHNPSWFTDEMVFDLTSCDYMVY